MSAPESTGERINRDDIRNKFAELTGGLDDAAGAVRTPLLGAGVGIMAIVVLLAFWLGRRKGRASRTVVEVRRV